MWFGKKEKKKNALDYAQEFRSDNINYELIRAMVNESQNHVCEVILPNGYKIVVRPIVENNGSNRMDILDL